MLRQKLEDYLRLQNEVAELKKKQSELEKLVDYTEEWKEDYVVAQVVARSPDRFNDVIVIDRGREDGIRPNMPVITPEGLIGRIESVTDSMANVIALDEFPLGGDAECAGYSGRGEGTGCIWHH